MLNSINGKTQKVEQKTENNNQSFLSENYDIEILPNIAKEILFKIFDDYKSSMNLLVKNGKIIFGTPVIDYKWGIVEQNNFYGAIYHSYVKLLKKFPKEISEQILTPVQKEEMREFVEINRTVDSLWLADVIFNYLKNNLKEKLKNTKNNLVSLFIQTLKNLKPFIK